VSTCLQVEHLDGVVYLGRDEEGIPLEINCEVIKVPDNFWKVRGTQSVTGACGSAAFARAGMQMRKMIAVKKHMSS
jgi:hypothetical protein